MDKERIHRLNTCPEHDIKLLSLDWWRGYLYLETSTHGVNHHNIKITEGKNMQRFNADKVAMIAVLVAIVTNPLTGQYILQGLEWVFTQIFAYGSPINLAASVVIAVYVASKVFKGYKTNVPPKSAKTQKAGKYITV